jgi:catechol 2,3-dioxygenase-like lactoylglutathione lyase family enzyme
MSHTLHRKWHVGAGRTGPSLAFAGRFFASLSLFLGHFPSGATRVAWLETSTGRDALNYEGKIDRNQNKTTVRHGITRYICGKVTGYSCTSLNVERHRVELNLELAMMQTLGHVALVVREYDEALAFFTRTLKFRVIEDTRLSEDKRWVLIAPPGSQGTSLLLARAATPEQVSRIGNQTGGRVFLFLHTDDFWRDYNEMTARKVKFTRPPSEEPYGTVAVFEDLYGNQWDLLQRKT